MATILLIEPHPLLRLGLRHLLAMPEINGPIFELDPTHLPDDDARMRDADLMVYGWHRDGPADWAGLDALCRWLSPQRVLVLADGLTTVPAPLPPAVCGLLSKTCSAEVLRAAMRLVLAGGECFPAPLSAQFACDRNGRAKVVTLSPTPGQAAPTLPPGKSPKAASIAAPARRAASEDREPAAPAASVAVTLETPSDGSHLLNITERQYEVLALLARGYPIKTVSRLLNISVATAKTHACTLYQRLQVRNKGEAVYEALRRGAKLNWPGPSAAVLPRTASRASLTAVCQAA